jgi:hypothetical protein
MIELLFLYSLLGAGIKYIDSAYDEQTFNKKIALIIAPIIALIWVFTMVTSPVSATILLAILMGVIFKGKIDNYAHLSGVIIIFPLLFYVGINIMIIPFLFLSAAAFLDEVGNDYVSTINNRKIQSHFLIQFVKYFFDQRWLMKSSLLFLSLIGLIPLIFFVAMVFFDYAYLGVRLWSDVKAEDKYNNMDTHIIWKKLISSPKSS